MENKESKLSYKLFVQQEESNFHLSFDDEMGFYNAVKNGDFEMIKKTMQPLSTKGMGTLSRNPLRNMKYHLIVTIAMITRFCIEGGMQSEDAYTLSDIYINQLDTCHEEEELITLHREVVYDYTERMQKLKKRKGFSKPVILSSEYIYNHLNEKLSLDEIAEHIGMNKTYLCELYKKETGITMFQYATNLKIQAAKNMLMYTDFKPADISTNLAFASHSHFIATFKKYTGMTPNEWRKLHYKNNFEKA